MSPFDWLFLIIGLVVFLGFVYDPYLVSAYDFFKSFSNKKTRRKKILSGKIDLKDKTVPPVEEIWAEVQKIQAEVQQLRTTLELLSQENKTKECPSCHSPALPESAVVCPSCGYRF